MSTSDPFGLVGAVLDKKYRVDDVVAQGGFGVVYRGVHVVLKRAVALKVLHLTGTSAPDADALVAQFEAEGEYLARLDHPAVVRVLDIGAADAPNGRRVTWMALEWIEGCTLKEDLNARSGQKGRSPDEAMALLRPLFEAVAQAHALGIVHRDIKPANVMLVAPSAAQRGSARPTVRLLDFGIAKIMAPDQLRPAGGDTSTTPGMSAFSLRYAAPEQIGGTRTGPWTDVHALALVLTHTLTDKPPIEGGDSLSLAASLLSPERPTPARLGVDVGDLEPVLARALALRPSDRFQTAQAFLDALDAVVAPAARPASVPPTTPVPAVASVPPVAPTPAVPAEPPVARSRRPHLVLAGVAAIVALSAISWVRARSREPVVVARDAAAIVDVAAVEAVTAPDAGPRLDAAPLALADAAPDLVATDNPPADSAARLDHRHGQPHALSTSSARADVPAAAHAPADASSSTGPRHTTVAPLPLSATDTGAP